METMWIWYALLVMVTWGIGDVFAKKGMQKISPVWNNILAVCFAVFVWIPFALFHGGTFSSLTRFDLLLSSIIALLYLTYYYAIERGKLILTATLLSTYQVTAVILSIIFLGERPTLIQFVAILLIAAGTFLISSDEVRRLLKILKTKTSEIKISWVVWGLFGGFCNGIGDFLSKIGVVKTGPYNFLLALAIGYTLSIGINLLFDKKGLKRSPWKAPKLFIYTLIGTGFVELGLIALNLAFETGPASLISPIISSSIVVTVILAALFLKEKITKIELFGVVATITGILLLSLTG